MRKAKRKGIKDVEAYLEQNKRGAKRKEELKKKEKAKKNALPKAPSVKPADQRLEDIYTQESNKKYLESMIDKDEKDIAYYESKLGMKKKSNKGKRLFQDMMHDDEDGDLFDFLDDISKKVHSSEPVDYSQYNKQAQEKKPKASKKAKEVQEEEVYDDEEEIGEDTGYDEEYDEAEDGFGEEGEEGEEGDEGEEANDEEVGDDEFFNMEGLDDGEEFGEEEEGQEEEKEDGEEPQFDPLGTMGIVI